MTIYSDEIYELTTERKEFYNKCCVWQMLRSDSHLTVSKDIKGLSTSSSDNSHSLWATAFAEVTFETV